MCASQREATRRWSDGELEYWGSPNTPSLHFTYFLTTQMFR